MRFLRAILPLFLVALGAAADDDAASAWSADRPLVWDDFRGPVPADAPESRVAATAASIGWSYEYQLQLSGRTCEMRINRISSSASFDPSQSWVRPEHRNARVLEHERVHFHITEIFRRKFDAATRELIDSTHACSARRERQAARFAERLTEDLVGSIYDEIWRQYRLEQEAYDRETNHGTDQEAQSGWTSKITSLLATEPDAT